MMSIRIAARRGGGHARCGTPRCVSRPGFRCAAVHGERDAHGDERERCRDGPPERADGAELQQLRADEVCSSRCSFGGGELEEHLLEVEVLGVIS